MKYSNLTIEQKILLYLLSADFNRDYGDFSLTETDLKTADYNAVIKESILQAVPLFALNSASKLKDFIDENIFSKWINLGGYVLTNNQKVVAAQKELTAALEKAGFSYVIIKGLSAAQNYPSPSLRALGDVDFLILPKDKEKVAKLVKSLGYTGEDVGHICHVTFQKDKVDIEMHFEVAGIPNGEVGEKVKSYLSDLPEKGIRITVSEETFMAPPQDLNGLVFLLHMQHHMLSEGLGLRHLLDWAYYVDRIGGTKEEEKFIKIVQDIGLFVYAGVITKVCHNLFGSTLPAWAEDADEEVSETVALEILSYGNFGAKDYTAKFSGTLVSNRGKNGTKDGKVKNGFIAVHNAVKARSPKAYKWVIPYPFLFIYEVARYGVLSATGKRPSVKKISASASERKRIYEKLKIFETEKQ